MKVRRISMSIRILIYVAVLLLITDVITGAVFYKKSRALLISQMRENIANMAGAVAANIDGAAFDAIQFGDMDSENYKKIYDQLAVFRDNSGAEYVYSIKEKDGEMVYSVDTATDMQAENGDEFAAIEGGIAEAINTGKPAADDEPYTDDWGTHYTAYAPVYNGSNMAGLICVDTSFAWVQEQSRNILIMVVSICGAAFILGILLLILISRRLAKGFKTLNNKVEELAGGGGDLTKKIEIHSGDEFEVIGENINKLVAYIREVMISIINGAGSLEEATNAIFGRLEEAGDDTSTVGATLEELSASMINTQEAMEEIYSLVGGINEVFGGIVAEVHDGSDYAHGIRKQAQDTGDEAMRAQENARVSVKAMQDAIQEKLDQSEAVKQINALTENILSIASQTNLLALNASIEAARAGDAGRGFAVVATEIGTLATDSAGAAGEIQRVSAEVIQAVQDLAEEAKRMMEFIDTNVLQSYDRLVETSEKYRESAEHVDDIMTKFAEMSTNVQRDIDEIKHHTNAVNDSVRVSTDAITAAADKASGVSGNISGINTEAEKATHISDELGDAVGKFKVN